MRTKLEAREDWELEEALEQAQGKLDQAREGLPGTTPGSKEREAGRRKVRYYANRVAHIQGIIAGRG